MSNPLAHRLVAHRGSPTLRPENTIVGAELAVSNGAKFFEVDIQLTSDLVPILYHDGDLKRLSGLNGNVYETPWSDLQNARASYPERFGDEFHDTPIATLQQLMDRLSDWAPASVFIELKIESLDHFGVDQALSRILPIIDAPNGRDQIAAVISKNDIAIEQTRQECSLPIGWVLPEWSAANQQRATDLSPDFIFCNQKRLPSDPADLWQGDWKWCIYTVNDTSAAQDLLTDGFDLVETDEIQKFLSHPQ